MKANAWLKPPAVNPRASVRLFCFPYAGGTASAFRLWSQYLHESIEVCPIQLPGREDRLGEKPLSSLGAIIDALLPVITPCLDRPFAFYGHSMGSLIAFELARELRRSGKPEPLGIFVSGRCAPQVEDPDPPMHKLAEDEFIEGLRNYNGTPEAVLQNRELMELLIPLLRADFEVSETYQYCHEAPLDCPIFAYAGLAEISAELIDDWRHQTGGSFHSALFPGDHFFLNSDREAFVNEISNRLLSFSNKPSQSEEGLLQC